MAGQGSRAPPRAGGLRLSTVPPNRFYSDKPPKKRPQPAELPPRVRPWHTAEEDGCARAPACVPTAPACVPTRHPFNRLTPLSCSNCAGLVFHSQQEAFEALDSNRSRHSNASLPSAPLCVWAHEVDRDGKRRFLLATRDSFWRRYRRLRKSFRAYYELIRESTPCHLYLDIEYKRTLNPHTCGERVMRTLRAALLKQMEITFGLRVDPSAIVELNSTTDAKFSRHIILHLEEMAFADNRHCGLLVSAMCKALHEAAAAGDEEAHACMIVASDGGAAETLPIDQGVYTRNRCFRLYKSSKQGKTAELLPLMNEEELAFLSHRAEEALFLKSLVTNVAPQSRMLRCAPENGCAEGGAPSSSALSSSLSGGILGVSAGVDGAAGSEATLSIASQAEMRAGGGPKGRERGPGGSSPFPELEAFMLHAWSIRTRCETRSRVWEFDRGRQVFRLVLAPSNRWCAHVGRAHRSNGTVLIASLKRRTFQQFCFDSECREQGFRGSDEFPIPPQLCACESEEPRMLQASQSIDGERSSTESPLASASTAPALTASDTSAHLESLSSDDASRRRLSLSLIDEWPWDAETEAAIAALP